MNRTIAVALFNDALAQVLDNKMFRLLLVLLALFVLPTFVVGAREDGLVVFYFWEFTYAEFLALFGSSQEVPKDIQVGLVQGLQAVLVDGIAGGLGIVFSIAATAFFLPRMLEKGSADTIFSKPVSRLVLMLSRYFSGILFVAILAVLLVGGMHVGLLLNSGYSDPGFLWSILTLVYLFSIVHAVSILIGVMTRSSVAAILMTLLFYTFNGCVQQAWRVKEMNIGEALSVARSGKLEPEAAQDAVAAAKEEQQDDNGPFVKFLLTSLDVVHYVLPKTSDAELIAKKLRRSFEDRSKELVDSEAEFAVPESPEGFTRLPGTLLDENGVVWVAPHPSRGGEARLVLRKQPAAKGSRPLDLAKALRDEKRQDPAAEEVDLDSVNVADRRAHVTQWIEKRGTEVRLRRATFLQPNSEWVLALDYDAERDWAAEHEPELERFLAELQFTNESAGFGALDPYQKRFGWDAPLKYNAFFSIGSTLAFVLVVLALSWRKLARIDF